MSGHRYRSREIEQAGKVRAKRAYVRVYTEPAVMYPHPMMHKWKCPECLVLNAEMAKGNTGTGYRNCSQCGKRWRLWCPKQDRRSK